MPAGSQIQLEEEFTGSSGNLISSTIPCIPGSSAVILAGLRSFSGTCDLRLSIRTRTLQNKTVILALIRLTAIGVGVAVIPSIPSNWLYFRQLIGTTVNAVYTVDLILLPPSSTPI